MPTTPFHIHTCNRCICHVYKCNAYADDSDAYGEQNARKSLDNRVCQRSYVSESLSSWVENAECMDYTVFSGLHLTQMHIVVLVD